MGFFDDIGKWGTRLFNAPRQESQAGLDKIGSSQQETMFNELQKGIAPWQQDAFQQAINQATTKMSAANAVRGGMNPFTVPQIVSSATQYTAPQFALANTNTMANLVGMRNRSSGSQIGSGIGYNYLSSPYGQQMISGGIGKVFGLGGTAAQAGASWLGKGLF